MCTNVNLNENDYCDKIFISLWLEKLQYSIWHKNNKKLYWINISNTICTLTHIKFLFCVDLSFWNVVWMSKNNILSNTKLNVQILFVVIVIRGIVWDHVVPGKYSIIFKIILNDKLQLNKGDVFVWEYTTTKNKCYIIAERCFFYKYIELKTVSISYHNFKTCCRLMRVLFIILIPKNVDFSLHEIIWMIPILFKSFRFLLHAFFYFEYCRRFILILKNDILL